MRDRAVSFQPSAVSKKLPVSRWVCPRHLLGRVPDRRAVLAEAASCWSKTSA